MKHPDQTSDHRQRSSRFSSPRPVQVPEEAESTLFRSRCSILGLMVVELLSLDLNYHTMPDQSKDNLSAPRRVACHNVIYDNGFVH